MQPSKAVVVHALLALVVWQTQASAIESAAWEASGDEVETQRLALLSVFSSLPNFAEVAAIRGYHGWTNHSAPCGLQKDTAAQTGPKHTNMSQPWTGVTCQEGLVVALDLSSTCLPSDLNHCSWRSHLHGQLPEDIGQISTLRLLNLSANSLSGSLPESWAEQLGQLEVMDLSANDITGTLPAEWGAAEAFQALEVMHIQDTALSGTLPSAWTQGFQLLTQLNLSNTFLSGSLPASWGQNGAFPHLVAVDLSSNWVSGKLPESWGQETAFQKLLSLNIRDSRLTGTLPASWAKGFHSLESMILDSNWVQGTLPGAWGQPGAFSKLKTLALFVNEISGTLPPEWAQGFPSLEYLGLQNNNIKGTLPASWAHGFPSIQHLLASLNELTGTLPEEWGVTGAFPQLVDMQLNSNSLEGTLPSSWGQGILQSMQFNELYLDSNRLSGTLPAEWLTANTNVHTMVLGMNQLTGTLPTVWQAQKLQQLGVFGNSLSGTVPDAAWAAAFPSLVRLDVSHNNLSGSVPISWNRTAMPSLKAACFFPNALCTTNAPLHFEVCSTCAVAQGRNGTSKSPSLVPCNSTVKQCDSGLALTQGAYGAPVASGSSVPIEGIAIGLVLALAAGLGAVAAVYIRQRRLARARMGAFDPNRHMSGELDALEKGTFPLLANPYNWTINDADLTFQLHPQGGRVVLGMGGFGTVYKATWRGGMAVAVKVVEVRGDYEEKQGELVQEIEILQACKSPYIVQFLGASMTPTMMVVVTELMAGGSLSVATRAGKVSWYKGGCSIALDVAQALHYLHENRIVHLDVKSGNVLLTGQGQAKVADVGMAHILTKTFGEVSLRRGGTFAWMAPEVLIGGAVCTKADVFSFGLVMWEMCTGEPPPSGRGNRREPHVPSECPPSIAHLISRCTQLEPEQRPAMNDIIPLLRRNMEVVQGLEDKLHRANNTSSVWSVHMNGAHRDSALQSTKDTLQSDSGTETTVTKVSAIASSVSAYPHGLATPKVEDSFSGTM